MKVNDIQWFVMRLFYAADVAFEKYILPAVGKVWRLEMKLRGVNIGTGSISGRPVVKLYPNSNVVVSDGILLISSNRRCSSGSIYAPCKLVTHSSSSEIIIDENVGLNGTSIVSRSARISIGKRTMIAPNVTIMDSPYHKLWPLEERSVYSGVELDDDVKIGSDVWIGNGCILLPGTNLGNGCVVAARSVVSGSFPPNTLIAGVPAKAKKNLEKTKEHPKES